MQSDIHHHDLFSYNTSKMDIQKNTFDSNECYSNALATVHIEQTLTKKSKLKTKLKCDSVELMLWNTNCIKLQQSPNTAERNECAKIPKIHIKIYKMFIKNTKICNFLYFINNLIIVGDKVNHTNSSNSIRTKANNIKLTLSGQFVQLFLVMCIISAGLIHIADGK